MQYIFQTTTTLLAVLSAGAKTTFLWNSWTPSFKFQKMNLGSCGRISNFLQKKKNIINNIKTYLMSKYFKQQGISNLLVGA